MKKPILAIAITATLATSAANAAIIDMDYNGLFSLLAPTGEAIQNTSYPYYGDAIWGYGMRTQITGAMSFDTLTGTGSGSITSFNFFSGGPMSITDVNFQSIGSGLILGNMKLHWGGSIMTSNIVLDSSGLFSAIANGTLTPGAILDQTSCASITCATPASDGINNGSYPIGPVPIATSSFNTTGQTGVGTTLGQLSLGTDDGIGGSPMDNGAFSGFSTNFDFTSLTVTNVSAVPVPAAIWLFGTGLLSLIGVSRRKQQS